MFHRIKSLFRRDSKSFSRPTGAELGFVINISDEGVSFRGATDSVRAVKWDDLQAVFIDTIVQGPFTGDVDVVWLLMGKKIGLMLPLGAEGEEALVKRLQTLDGFNNRVLIKAMSTISMRKQRFVCWKKK
jgi:hypothetical protein